MRMQLGLGSVAPADPLLTTEEAQHYCAISGGTWVPPSTGMPLGGCARSDQPITGETGGPDPVPSQLPGSCGINVCTWWDDVWVRDDCLSYLRCASPSDPRVVAMDQGFFSGAGAAVGSAAGSTLRGTLSGLFQNADGSTNWVVIGLVGVATAALVFSKTR